MTFRDTRIGFLVAQFGLLCWPAVPLQAADLTVNTVVAFSALDGGTQDEDASADGVLTVSSLTVTDAGQIVLDRPSCHFDVSGVVRLEGRGTIRTPSVAVPSTGPEVVIRAGQSVQLVGTSGIVTEGVAEGGALSICSQANIELVGRSASLASSGVGTGARGGQIRLEAAGNIRLNSDASSVSSNGASGGAVRFVACGTSNPAVLIKGSVSAIGRNGAGGSVEVIAKRGAILFQGRSNRLVATGSTGAGTIRVTAGTTVTPNPPPASPRATVTTNSPSSEPCARCCVRVIECADGNVCTDDACTRGACANTNNALPCNDANACTTNDACSGGTCAGGPPPSCDDANACTDDSCNSTTGCQSVNNSASCDDQNACTTGDACAAGICLGVNTSSFDCEDDNPCTDDSCDPLTGCVHAGNALPCDDGLFCTATDICSEGACVGATEACPGQFCDEDADACALIAISSPTNLSLTNAETVDVVGTFTGNPDSVTVNEFPAVIQGSGFSAIALSLREGTNVFSALARYPGGGIATANVQVVRDTTPPRVVISSPADNSKVFVPTVTIAGIVNDTIVAAVNNEPPIARVAGFEIPVTNNAFVAVGVPLVPGLNVIDVTATDRAGNSGMTAVRIRYDDSAVKKIELGGGNNQSAFAGQPLADVLVARLVDENSQPVAGAPMIFRVTQNDGQFADGTRLTLVPTDGLGEASVMFSVGSRSGDGCNRVEATSVGFSGRAIFVATTLPGPAAKINVSSGFTQRGMVNSVLPEPLGAIVTDEGGNPIVNLPVTYHVSAGGGRIAENGSDTYVVNTDLNGRTAATLILGPLEGIENNSVEATPEGLTALPAVFKASAFAPGNPLDTTFSGVVLDHVGEPLQGVTAQIQNDLTGTRVLTNEQGQFLLVAVPVGHVRLIIDGSTANRPGKWPVLEYDVVMIPGRENTVGAPIHLLPIAENAPLAGGDDPVELTLPNVPGFKMTILPHSTSFACQHSACAFEDCVSGRCPTGTVTVTQVHSDKIPMTPADGLQPTLILTIQPPDVRFDPPAPICYPNSDGLRPGEMTGMYSFDHDLGRFVSIGSGTVSEDGSIICSDPGFGIIKGGWHCAGPSRPQGGAEPSTARITQGRDQFVCRNRDVSLSAVGTPTPGNMSWASGGTPATGTGLSYTTRFSQSASSQAVTATWTCESGEQGSDTAAVMVVDSDGTVPTGVGPPLNYLPILSAGTPTGWGVTRWDGPIIDITPYCDSSGASWRVVVTQADIQIRQSVRLLAGVDELTAALVSAETSCSVLDTMFASLISVATQGGDSGYYMVSAVQAHETLHVTQYQASIAPAYVTLKSTLEALSVPLSDFPTVAQAKAGIRALPAYFTATATFGSAHSAAISATAAHNPVKPFNDAELAAVAGRLTEIQARKTTLHCP